jgi:putative sterol carrier protein
MAARAQPPEDISPHEFFTVWVPRTVEEDPSRRTRLGDTAASLVFVLTETVQIRSEFTIHIAGGRVRGEPGRVSEPDLHVEVDLETWRALNRGDISAPEALLRKRLHYRGSLVLALKLHLILG